jgi:hypothetical protein
MSLRNCTLENDVGPEVREAGHILAGSAQAFYEAAPDGIRNEKKDHGDRRCRALGIRSGLGSDCDQDIDFKRDQLVRHASKSFRDFVGKAMLKDDVARMLVSEVSEPFDHPREISPFFLGAPGVPENTNFGNPPCLRAGDARHGQDACAGPANKIPPCHPITWPDDWMPRHPCRRLGHQGATS